MALPIIQISLPTPWPSTGPVHVYLVKDDPVTLIDTGLNMPASREALLDGLKAAGIALTDIKRVLLTHAHLDHYGQARLIQEASGAPVFLSPLEEGKADSPEWWVETRDRILDECGVPQTTQQHIEEVWQKGRDLALPMPAWTPLAEGQRFEFDHGALTAVHLPGHALGHTGFFEEETGTLVGGDHLLEGITPNPVLEPLAPGQAGAVPHAPNRALTLGQFLDALAKVTEMPVKQVLPGHGPIITDHAAVAAGYMAKHQRRLDALAGRIGDGTSAFDLTRIVYPKVREFDIFLALSEVLAHLDLLVVRGQAAVDAVGGTTIYRLSQEE